MFQCSKRLARVIGAGNPHIVRWREGNTRLRNAQARMDVSHAR